MPKQPLHVLPIQAPIQAEPFNLISTITQAIADADETLYEGDVLALSSKYVAISEGRIVDLDSVLVSREAQALADRYNMDGRIAQLVYEEASHIFGGIPMGFLLTDNNGVISPNAGLDRSNIPSGKAVLLPAHPYESASRIRQTIKDTMHVDVGVILTDSWLMPGRLGTTGVALATAGFKPIQDERGKEDLFGNPMAVTQVGIADSISVCAQMVMGERDEATPIAIVRNTGVELTDARMDVEDVAIDWRMCIYIESLTLGILPDGAPTESLTAQWANRDKV